MLPQLFSKAFPADPKFRLSLIPGAFNILQKHSADTQEHPTKQAVLKPHLLEPCHHLYVMNVNDANCCFFIHVVSIRVETASPPGAAAFILTNGLQTCN